jgi:hypothetical protein
MEVIKLLGLLTLLAGLGVVLVVVGYQSTKLLMSKGVEQFAGAERAAAEDALIDAHHQCRDHPSMRGLIPKICVKDSRGRGAVCT